LNVYHSSGSIYFLNVIQLEVITKASEEPFHDPSQAVSIQLKKNCRNQFDIPLTQVVGRQLPLTDFGERNSGNSGGVSFRKMGEPDIKHQGFFPRHHDGEVAIAAASTGSM